MDLRSAHNSPNYSYTHKYRIRSYTSSKNSLANRPGYT